MTNVANEMVEPCQACGPRHPFVLFERLLDRVTPVVSEGVPQPEHEAISDEPPAQLTIRMHS